MHNTPGPVRTPRILPTSSGAQNINLHQVEAFLLVADLQGFTKAARVLRLTPSALSRSIQQLENQLGTRLFSRDTHSVILTAEGVEFVNTARRLLDERNRGLKLFEQFVNGQRGRLRIASLPSIFISVLAPVISAFQRLEPGADISVSDGSAEETLEAVRSGDADLGLGCFLQPNIDVKAEPLLRDRFSLVCPQDHPLAKLPGPVTWRQLAKYPFVACGRKSSVRFFTDNAFLQAGVQIQCLFEPSTLRVVGSLVAQGLGVTALPDISIAAAVAGFPTLVRRPLDQPEVERTIFLLTKAETPPSPLLRVFLDFLRGQLTQQGAPSGPATGATVARVAAERTGQRG